MPKPIAAFDLDGTLFKTSMLDTVFSVAVSEGIIPPDERAKVDEANNVWVHTLNTEQSYQNSVKLTVQVLHQAMHGRSPEELRQLAERAAATQLRKRRFVYEAMRLLQSTHEIAILSASLIDITEIFLVKYDIPVRRGMIFGSEWSTTNGRFDGKGETLRKSRVVESLVERGRVAIEGSCAFGDTISDFFMLDTVETGVMVNPSATLETAGAHFHKVQESKDTMTHTLPHESPEGISFTLQTTEEVLHRIGLLQNNVTNT